jgi:hypothetical protein
MSRTLLLQLYAAALALYPAAFRAHYGAEMLDAVGREYDVCRGRARFVLHLAGDTAMSVIRENLRATPSRPLMLAGFVMFFSLLLFALAMFDQQRLRRGADYAADAITAQVAAQPQSAEARLAAPAEEISSPEWLDSVHSFLALYDASGKAISANATFEGSLPQPPRGIFATIRSRGLYKVTWQPQRGVRVALTGRPLPDGGFVVAGQSLLPGEAETASFYRHLLLLWAVMAAACCALFVNLRLRGARRGL